MLIGLIAILIVGPDRLPAAAASFARFVRNMRDFANSAKTRMRDELGPEYDDIDWRKLDPRQYDPRRIIREALLDDGPVETSTPTRVESASSTTSSRNRAERSSSVTPFDDEAT